MQLMAWDFTQSAKLDLGDLDKIDWDVSLKEIVRIYDDRCRSPRKIVVVWSKP